MTGKSTTRTVSPAECRLLALIIATRVDRDITKSAMATVLGVSYQQYSKYESGQNRMSLGTFCTAAAFLGCDVESVLVQALTGNHKIKPPRVFAATTPAP